MCRWNSLLNSCLLKVALNNAFNIFMSNGKNMTNQYLQHDFFLTYDSLSNIFFRTARVLRNMKRVSLIWFLVILNVGLLLTILAKFFNPGFHLYNLLEKLGLVIFISRISLFLIIWDLDCRFILSSRQSPSHCSTKSDCSILRFD